MRLLLDVGNMRVKWALAHNSTDEVVDSGVLADDWSDLACFAGEIDSVWVSCVASSSVLESLKSKVQQYFEIACNVVTVSSEKAGMKNNYADLRKLGVDRWVAALGARSVAPKGALIVIDAGTAVTIDLVSAKNCFEGGVILPGFTTMHDALIGRTARIESHRTPVHSVIGKNTRDCVNSGVQYGLIGAIERVVFEIAVELEKEQPRIILTGGDAEAIAAGSKLEVELQSNIIFHGLMLLSKK